MENNVETGEVTFEKGKLIIHRDNDDMNEYILKEKETYMLYKVMKKHYDKVGK